MRKEDWQDNKKENRNNNNNNKSKLIQKTTRLYSKSFQKRINLYKGIKKRRKLKKNSKQLNNRKIYLMRNRVTKKMNPVRQRKLIKVINKYRMKF
jgi:hypothetical protein